MKILFISPEFEEQGRGITGIIKSMVRAAKANGHEVGVLAGYPNVSAGKNELLDTKVEHIYLQHYLNDGRKSIFPNGLHGKKTLAKILLGRQYLKHTEIRIDHDLIIHSRNLAHDLDYLIKVPFCYQFINHGMTSVVKPVIKHAIKKYGVDVVITGSPMSLAKKDVAPAKLVQFVHDVMPIELMETPADNGTPYRFAQQLHDAACQSDLILVNSNDTKQKVLEVNKDANIKVVYGTASAIPADLPDSEILRSYDLKKDKFLLFVSVVERRKNLSTLFDAFSRSFADIKMPLVIVGGKGFGYKEIIQQYKLLPLKIRNNIHFTGFVSEADKYTLFRNANSFVFPSIYEGIGLPIIEAFSCGLPVLTSRRGALPEAGGKAAFYIDDPYDIEEIADGIVKVATDESLRSELRSHMPEQLAKFTNEQFAARFAEGIDSLKDR